MPSLSFTPIGTDEDILAFCRDAKAPTCGLSGAYHATTSPSTSAFLPTASVGYLSGNAGSPQGFDKQLVVEEVGVSLLGIHFPSSPSSLTNPPTHQAYDDPDLGDYLKRYRLPEQASQYTSEVEIMESHNSLTFASHLRKPLNVFITINLASHDRWGPGIRDIVWASLRYVWRDFGGLYANYVYENSPCGGVGIHLHVLAHVPLGRHDDLVTKLNTVLAKSYQQKLTRLLEAHTPAMQALGFPKLGSRAKWIEKHAALERLKTIGQGRACKTQSDLDAREASFNRVHLPFYVSKNTQGGALLSPEGAFWRLRYISKSADPAIKTTCCGVEMTIGGAFQDYQRRRDPTPGVFLEAQSKRRFKRGNMGSTENLDRDAQAACAGFTPPNLPLGDWLPPKHEDKHRLAWVKAFLEAHYAHK